MTVDLPELGPPVMTHQLVCLLKTLFRNYITSNPTHYFLRNGIRTSAHPRRFILGSLTLGQEIMGGEMGVLDYGESKEAESD